MINLQEKLPTQVDIRRRSWERMTQIVAFRDEGLLLREIAERAGVTKERVRQILAKARVMGVGPKAPQQVGTRQASRLMGMSPETRPSSFLRLMDRLAVSPAANKRGRLYWNVESLLNVEHPRCVMCQSPVALGRCMRSVTCSPQCSIRRRSQSAIRRREKPSGGRVLAASGAESMLRT